MWMSRGMSVSGPWQSFFTKEKKKKLYLLAGGQDFLGMDTGIRTFG